MLKLSLCFYVCDAETANMSIGSSTDVASIHGNESTRDSDTPHSNQHSALLYLFQEVSKLASPIPSTFSGTNSPSAWLNETKQSAVVVRKDEEDTNSPKISNKTCQYGLPHIAPYSQEKKVKDRSSTVATLVQSHLECNSPWTVLSLINLQCERLLHHTDVEESDLSFESSYTKLGHSVDKVSTGTTNVPGQDSADDCISAECALRPSLSICVSEEIPASFSPAEDVCSREASCFKYQCCMKDSAVGCCVHSYTAGQMDTCKLDLVKQNATAASQSYYRDQKEERMSIKDCFSFAQDIVKVSSPENSLSQATCLPNAPLSVRLTFHSNVDASAPLPKPALTLDRNANLELIPDTQHHPLSVQPSSLLFSSNDMCQSPPVQDDNVTASLAECTGVPKERKKPPDADLTSPSHEDESASPAESSAASEPGPSTVQKDGSAASAAKQWRTKTPRKQPHPSRSVDIQDPDFQGVTFRIDTELDDSREQCRLLITSKYR